MPRQRTGNPTVGMTAEEAEEALDLDFEYDDTSTLGHLVLREQRQRLYYARLIEHEMPKLVGKDPTRSNIPRRLTSIYKPAYRKAFVPPTSATPLIVRSIDYAGEEHPATVKRCIVAPVNQLPLNDERSIHKIKLLAGPRWTPDPPSDSGVSPNDPGREHGYIKIACEDFPKPAMNLKWASDALDRLIAEANVRSAFYILHIICGSIRNIEYQKRFQQRTARHEAHLCKSAESEERGAYKESSWSPSILERLSEGVVTLAGSCRKTWLQCTAMIGRVVGGTVRVDWQAKMHPPGNHLLVPALGINRSNQSLEACTLTFSTMSLFQVQHEPAS
jgi:hypothetical protein